MRKTKKLSTMFLCLLTVTMLFCVPVSPACGKGKTNTEERIAEDVQSELRSIVRNAQKIVYSIEPYLESPNNPEKLNKGFTSNLIDDIDLNKLTRGTVGKLHAINNGLVNTQKILDRILVNAWTPEGEADMAVQASMESIYSNAFAIQYSAQNALDLMGLPGYFIPMTPHSPITIYSNGDFTTSNGVTGGSGTSTDPYIIEGWNISASTYTGIYIRDTDAHFVIRHVWVHSGGNTGSIFDNGGIFIRDVSNGTIEKSWIRENLFGIYLCNTPDIHLESNIISDNGGGVSLSNSPYAEIVNNDIFNNDETGLGLRLSNHSVITENDLFKNGDNGIFISSSMDVTITHNRALENGMTGIGISGTDDITIYQNDAIENDGSGISIGSSTDVSITHNRALENGMTGIGIGGTDDITIYQNDAIENDGSGISIGTSTDVSITHNRALENGMTGIGIRGTDDITIYQNDAIENDESGISIGTSTDVSITHNRALENGKHFTGHGIGISGSDDITIYQNDAIENDVYGISIHSSGEIWVIENLVTFNGICGIGISGGSSNIQVKENTILNNTAPTSLGGGCGVSIGSSSEVEVTDNFISSNSGKGVAVTRSTNIQILRNAILNNSGNENAIGIYVAFSSDVHIKCNDIEYHSGDPRTVTVAGIYLLSNNTGVIVVHNNLIYNFPQARELGTGNTWDDGYPSGGNYWNDFDELDEWAYDDYQGPNQDIPGSDGIVNEELGGMNPYIIDSDSHDEYPLIEPWEDTYGSTPWVPLQFPKRIRGQMLGSQNTLVNLNQRMNKVLSSMESES
jgi:parallel beta-helix repeat protein